MSASGKGSFPGAGFCRQPHFAIIISSDDYKLAATANHKGTKAQRTHKEIRGGPPALRSLRAVS